MQQGCAGRITVTQTRGSSERTAGQYAAAPQLKAEGGKLLRGTSTARTVGKIREFRQIPGFVSPEIQRSKLT